MRWTGLLMNQNIRWEKTDMPAEKKKLISVRVIQLIGVYDLELPSLFDTIKYLKELENHPLVESYHPYKESNVEIFNRRLKWEDGYDESSTGHFELWGDRWETDEEYEKRLEKNRKALEMSKKRKEDARKRKAKKDLETYEKLKKQFEGKIE